MKWFRAYNDTPNNPRLRLIAHQAGTCVSHAVSVWFSMLCHASENRGEKRGTLAGWDDAECALNLGIDRAVVFAIRREMEGRLLDGQRLIDWSERQYESDNAAERKRKWREKKEAEKQAYSSESTGQARDGHGTVPTKNRTEQTRLKTEGDKPPSVMRAARATRLPTDWVPSPSDQVFAHELGLNAGKVADGFCDYWHAKGGASATKTDWSATWRNWCRREAERAPARPGGKAGKLDWFLNDMGVPRE